MTTALHKTECRVIAVLIPVVSFALGALATAQPAVSTPAQFQSAAPEAKRAFLNALALHKASLEPSELVNVLVRGIQDSDPEVRAVALTAFASRAGSVRFKQTDARVQRWLREHPALMGVREVATAALRDPDERVRLAAILALGNLEYRLGDPPVGLRISDQLLQRLAHLFRSDPSSSVRQEIAKSFAWCSTESSTRTDLLLDALNDESPAVVAQAARGVGNMRLPEGLPRILNLLAHKDRNVRLVVAQALAEYGTAAVPFLGELRMAVLSETDGITKKTLEGAIRVLERSGRQ